MPGRNFLFVPGPTSLPFSVDNAMRVPQEDHRRPDFRKLTKPLFADLNRIFKTTKGQSFIFPATGTAGWEVALANTLSPGDKVISARYGQFSHLWIDLAQRIGLDVEFFETPWGEGFPVAKLKKCLEEDVKHEIKGVLVCHNETATGVTSDLAGVRKEMDAVKHPAMLYADGVSSIASIDFRMDEWGVDVALSGSQKGLMLPAGLAVVCVSQKARRAMQRAKCARCFLDLQDHINTNRDGFFPYTPSIPLLYGLRRTLDLLLEEEGLENVFKRHHRLAEGVRKAIRAWGLKMVARKSAFHSDTVTAIRVPAGYDARDVIEIAYYRYNLSLGAGLAELSGKAFRIGHLGDHNETSILAALATTEMAMLDAGLPIDAGLGVAAASEHFRKTAPKFPVKLSSGKILKDKSRRTVKKSKTSARKKSTAKPK